MADERARKAANRLEKESFDAQVGGPLVVYLNTAIDIAEEAESKLAPVVEALREAMNLVDSAVELMKRSQFSRDGESARYALNTSIRAMKARVESVLKDMDK